MKSLFASKEIFKVKSRTLNPAEMGEPVTAEDFFKRGMAYYARQQYEAAEADIYKAASLDNDSIDACYGLGMVYKALGMKEKASEAFSQAIKMIEIIGLGSSTRYDMLRRLALGHINMINQGDWNLEKEIWKRIA